jgi:hypothetical protein
MDAHGEWHKEMHAKLDQITSEYIASISAGGKTCSNTTVEELREFFKERQWPGTFVHVLDDLIQDWVAHNPNEHLDHFLKHTSVLDFLQ